MSDELIASQLAGEGTPKTTGANKETDADLAPVSPTGFALVSQWMVRVGVIVGALAAAIISISAALPALLPASVTGVATAVLAILATFGIASPGVRATPAK